MRKIESGDPSVSLKHFMVVLWNLGLLDEIFCSLHSDTYFDDSTALVGRRVRLTKPKEQDF